MATSNTVAFRPNIEDIINESFERCGLDIQTRTGDQAISARRSLNLLFSEWANRGINYWTVTQAELTLTKDVSVYDLPAGVLDFLDVVIFNTADSSRTDTIINRVTISEYNQIPNKTSKGRPNQYMFDKGRQTGSNNIYKLYLWQTPDIDTYKLNYWAMTQLDDVTLSNQDSDIPYTWSDCICAGLASKLAIKYAPDKYALLKTLYDEAFSFASQNDNDGVSLKLQPTGLNLV
tara:strand:+ start:100 stop:798 length:699 start_codon:yes stop_codon:yes gene_type:complete